MPETSFNTAIGRYIFLQLCGAAQLQRDLDSERMTAMTKGLFLDGRHRGNDPFGYRSARDERGKLRRPRQLEVVPHEAEVVRLPRDATGEKPEAWWRERSDMHARRLGDLDKRIAGLEAPLREIATAGPSSMIAA